MTVPVSNALQAYNRAVDAMNNGGMDARTSPTGDGFAELVREAAGSAVEALRAGETTGIESIKGQAGLTEVVTSITNAELMLQTVVSVRDRVIQAYQDIIRMPI